MVKQRNGFTILELMIVIVIIGILAAIAYPSYQEYVRKTERTKAQADMMELAGQLQRYRIANFTFLKPNGTAITFADLGHSGKLPQLGADTRYNLALINVTAGTWTLIATPTRAQTGDGDIVLNYRGERCWDKGNKTTGLACIPAQNTNWDGR